MGQNRGVGGLKETVPDTPSRVTKTVRALRCRDRARASRLLGGAPLLSWPPLGGGRDLFAGSNPSERGNAAHGLDPAGRVVMRRDAMRSSHVPLRPRRQRRRSIEGHVRDAQERGASLDV